MMSVIRTLLSHFLTGKDGETYAFGRVAGAGTGIVGLGVIIASAIQMFLDGANGEMWEHWFTGSALWIAAVAGAVVSMVSLTAKTEPKPPEDPKPEL
jgi:MFS family permease